jgi:hypothetical protein
MLRPLEWSSADTWGRRYIDAKRRVNGERILYRIDTGESERGK